MKSLTKESLGAKLRNLREDVHMEQEVVARVLKLPRTAIGAIESGKRDITAIELVELCKLYRIPPNDLFGWHSYKTRKINET